MKKDQWPEKNVSTSWPRDKKKKNGKIKQISNPLLEVGQLVEETLILRSRASDDSVENGARVEDLLLVHAVPHLPSSSLSRLIICQYYLFKWFDIIWTEELPILGPPLFCLHDGSGHGLSTTPCFVDGLDPSWIGLYGPGFQATIMLHFRNGTGGLDQNNSC